MDENNIKESDDEFYDCREDANVDDDAKFQKRFVKHDVEHTETEEKDLKEAGTELNDSIPNDAEDQPDEESDPDENLNEAEIEERKAEVKMLKEEGNEMFKSNLFVEACDTYSKGLKICPKCLKKERSILYSNRSACYMKLEKREEAIADCTKAVTLHPTYLKPLLRRAQLYEETDKLEEAMKDYEAVLELDPGIHTARAACMKLPEKIKERNEKLKEEMISKLKDLGNTLLRPFGLSTNNFNLQQDQRTGSYNIQFNNNPNQQQ